MNSTSLELQLNCNLYKEVKLKSYVVASLLYDHRSKYEKLSANLDTQGYVKLHFRDVNVNDSATLWFQVFIRRNSLLPDKHVGTLNVRVSDLMLPSTVRVSDLVLPSTDQEGCRMYEFATLWSGKTNKSVFEVSYSLSVAIVDTALIVPSHYAKLEMASKHALAPAI